MRADIGYDGVVEHCHDTLKWLIDHLSDTFSYNTVIINISY